MAQVQILIFKHSLNILLVVKYKYSKRIAENIARIRTKNGVSQTEMANYGISRSYYCKVEAGEHSLTLEKLVVIAKAIGCKPSDFFKDENGDEISYDDKR